jgi:streptogramin lyase
MAVRLRRVAVFGAVLAAALAAGAGGARPLLGQPFDVLPLPNGRLVVTDLPAGSVYELDPVRKTGRLLGRVSQARELARLPDGRLLVTSGARVLALTPGTGKTTVYATARSYILGIALAPDGWLYASENLTGHEETTIVRLRRGMREVLAQDLRGVHGILLTADGVILSEAYAGRVLRLDPSRRKTEVLATGLGNPSFTIPAGAGGYFVSEFSGNRISHLWPDGHVTKVADVFKPGSIAFDSHHRIVGVTNEGTVLRIVHGRAQTIYP